MSSEAHMRGSLALGASAAGTAELSIQIRGGTAGLCGGQTSSCSASRWGKGSVSCSCATLESHISSDKGVFLVRSLTASPPHSPRPSIGLRKN
jgi:hypothetical protein